MAKPNGYAVEMRRLNSIHPYEQNPRQLSEHAVAKVRASIEAFGFQQPIVVDRDSTIVVGHTRYLAALKLGLDRVPVRVARDLTPEQAKAYRIADNRVHEESTWAPELLGVEMRALGALNFDLLQTGFDQPEIDEMFGVTNELPDGIDDAPIRPTRPKTRPGDLWRLGEHRLLCGDATNPDDIARFGAPPFAHLVFTDPPYGVNYSGRGENDLGTIENDNLPDDAFLKLINDAFREIGNALFDLACVYISHPDAASGPKLIFEQAFANAFQKSATIIWVKQSAGMGWQDYRSQHEPILYGWKRGKGKHRFFADRTKTTVWKFDRDAQASYEHPTQKPVALFVEAIMNSSERGDTIFDPFVGSGTALLAAHHTGRRCFSIDIDPAFIDVAIERWQSLTGEVAIRDSDSKAFGDVKRAKA